VQYTGRWELGSPDPGQGWSASPGLGGGTTAPPLVIHEGATVYNNVSVGYNIQPINTRVEIGVDNVFDKQPPFIPANRSQNANTDPNDFDTIGRYYFGRVTVKF